jgi:hypothetical protein
MSVVNYFQDLSEPYGIRQKSERILTLIIPSMNRSWYHEPQLDKFEIRVNHNLEPRRPNKTYKGGSENLNGHTTFV